MVAGLVPWLITAWDVREELSHWAPVRVLGGILVLAGVAVLGDAFARFVREGLGTPAPVAPTRRLVVGGLYRHVRNPMYLAVTAVIVGQSLLLWEPLLAIYGAVVFALVASFVRIYEEPVLTKQFGAEYTAYRRVVPAWWPRLRPWRGNDLRRGGPRTRESRRCRRTTASS